MPFETKGGAWQPRCYQENTISAVLDGIADGKQRLLLTLATGTGKTAISFQIAWKLFHAKWNLRRDGAGAAGVSMALLYTGSNRYEYLTDFTLTLRRASGWSHYDVNGMLFVVA